MPAEEKQPFPFPDKVLNLRIVSVDRFIWVVRTISDNNLWGDVQKHLKGLGWDAVAVSEEPLGAIREMLRERSTSGKKSGPQRRLDTFLACACGDGGGDGNGDDDGDGDEEERELPPDWDAREK
ncbi:hypothetical protein [Streptomyces sp. CA2R101]|uniref:hypothetical protein n=1 Tax=Streptomyces sp. CA2R101 TaxID=3120152 RepID=UPI00300BE4DC